MGRLRERFLRQCPTCELCRPRHRLLPNASFAGIVAICSTSAYAQSVATPVTLPEIVVEGTNSDGSSKASGGFYVPKPSFGPLGPTPAKDIPFSVNSIPEKVIRDQQTHSPDEVLKNDPSIRAFPSQLSFAQNYLIRGFSVGPQYGIYQDGLDIIGYTVPAVENDSRVDIVKGATSILYGFAAPGGIVSYQTKAPLDVPLTELGIGYLSNSTVDEHIDVSRRFGYGKEFGVRLSVYQQNGGLPVYQTSAARNVQLLALDWKNEEMRVWTNVQHFGTTQRGGNTVLFLAPFTSKYLSNPADPTQSYGQSFFFQNLNAVMTDAGFDWSRNGWFVSTAIGYSNDTSNAVSNRAQVVPNRLDQFGNFGIVPYPYYFNDESRAARISVSKEIKLGIFTNTLSGTFSASRHDIGSGTGDEVAVAASNIYRPVYVAEPAFQVAPNFFQRYAVTAGILKDQLDIGQHLSLIGGGVRSGYYGLLQTLPDGQTSSRIRQDKITPLAAILIHANDRLTGYGSYIEALQPGAMAPTTAVNAGVLLPPFVGKQYEVGIKADVTRSLNVNAALFQVEQASSFLNQLNVFTAEGTQTNRGVELTFAGKLFPRLGVFGGATYIDPQVRNNSAFPDGKAIGVSKFRANLYGEYEVPDLSGLSLLAGGYYASRYLVQENLPAAIAQGFAQNVYARGNFTLDLGAKYATVQSTVPIVYRLYVTNVFNNAYWLNPNPNGGIVPGPPASVRFDTTARF